MTRADVRSASYGPVLAAYLAFAGATAYVVRRRGGREISEPRPGDVVLIGLATFRLSRLVSKDKVLQPVRQPFVEETSQGVGPEVNSQPAGTGVRLALGELLTCPFCISVWIATALTAGFAIAPGAARLTASGLAAVVVADASQYAYAGLRESASR